MANRPLLTITPNPSLDLLFAAETLAWDDANRVDDPRRRPGGQGVNVARAARALGQEAHAVVMLGGRTGEELETQLRAEGLPLEVVRADGETRTFVAVREAASGRSLLVNARGPARSPADVARLREAASSSISALRPAWVACCGSLPAGFPPDFYLGVLRAAKSAGACTVVDCDGDALRFAAPLCDLLVPNQHEAARLTGARMDGVADAAAAAALLLDMGSSTACITLGPAGAVLACAAGIWHAAAPPSHNGSAVGAGDTFLAALLAASMRDVPPPDALKRAVAAATAALESAGTTLVDPHRASALVAATSITRLK